MNTSVGKTLLEVVVGDIALLDVDAIVNAANNELWMGAGVAGAIKRAGGPEIEQEAMRQGPIAIGDAVATGGGTLTARWVIHAAVMGHDLTTDANFIAQATYRTLEVADRISARSVALPALGTGVGGFPIYACASIMVGRVRAYLVEQGRSGLRRVVFCAYDDVGAAAFKNALSGLTRFEA
jgi:O-acetyl-ADP-ribose deacetylase (regulator of RNase III)